MAKFEAERSIYNCYSAHCMRRKPAQIVKLNIACPSWKKTRNASESMRFFHEQSISLTTGHAAV